MTKVWFFIGYRLRRAEIANFPLDHSSFEKDAHLDRQLLKKYYKPKDRPIDIFISMKPVGIGTR